MSWSWKAREKIRGRGNLSPSFFLDSPRSVATASGFFKGKSRWSLSTVLPELLLPFLLLFFFFDKLQASRTFFPRIYHIAFLDKLSIFENSFRARRNSCKRDRKIFYFIFPIKFNTLDRFFFISVCMKAEKLWYSINIPRWLSFSDLPIHLHYHLLYSKLIIFRVDGTRTKIRRRFVAMIPFFATVKDLRS